MMSLYLGTVIDLGTFRLFKLSVTVLCLELEVMQPSQLLCSLKEFEKIARVAAVLYIIFITHTTLCQSFFNGSKVGYAHTTVLFLSTMFSFRTHTDGTVACRLQTDTANWSHHTSGRMTWMDWFNFMQPGGGTVQYKTLD